MKIQIPESSLQLAINRIHGTLADRVQATIALKASDNNLWLLANDRVVVVYSRFECEVMENGTAFVPGKFFSEVVRALPHGLVCLETHSSHLTIATRNDGEFDMKIPLVTEQIWQDPNDIESDNFAELPAARLSYLTEQVQFCIAQEAAKNFATVGFLHRSENGALRLVATDSYRLSYCETSCNELTANFLPKGICLSKRALAELNRMGQEGFDKIRLVVSKDATALGAYAKNYQLEIRLTDVKYPNYLGVLPTANMEFVNIGKDNLLSVVRRVLLAADKNNVLHIEFDQGSLTMSARTLGSSEGRELVPITGYRGQKRELFVNGKFLSEVLSTVPGDEIHMQFKGEHQPLVVIPREEPLDCKSFHLIVPILESQSANR